MKEKPLTREAGSGERTRGHKCPLKQRSDLLSD